MELPFSWKHKLNYLMVKTQFIQLTLKWFWKLAVYIYVNL